MANFVYVTSDTITSATLFCGHPLPGGKGAPLAPGSLTSTCKLTVKRARVVTAANITAATLVPIGCSQQTSASADNVPCATILSVTSKLSKNLTVDKGTPVVIDSLAGMTNGKPLSGNLTGSAGQSKLTAAATS